MNTLADLHAPLDPILRHVLPLVGLPRAGLALDLASGAGLKLPLLAEAAGPGLRWVALDRDVAAVGDINSRLRSSAAWPHAPRARRPFLVAGLAGDAEALPLRDGCCDALVCIAALGLFADQGRALREMRRVVRPGGLALLVTATQAWAEVNRWPPALTAQLSDAYRRLLAGGRPPVPAAPDVVGDLTDALGRAGFALPLARAFLLDGPPDPLAAELPLVSGPALAALLAPALPEAALAPLAAAQPEVELCPLALVAWAR